MRWRIDCAKAREHAKEPRKPGGGICRQAKKVWFDAANLAAVRIAGVAPDIGTDHAGCALLLARENNRASRVCVEAGVAALTEERQRSLLESELGEQSSRCLSSSYESIKRSSCMHRHDCNGTGRRKGQEERAPVRNGLFPIAGRDRYRSSTPCSRGKSRSLRVSYPRSSAPGRLGTSGRVQPGGANRVRHPRQLEARVGSG